MAFNGGGYVPPGSVFGGYSGGYTQTPDYLITPDNSAFGAPYVPGLNLPSVDPNTYSGTVHFGPPTTFVGTPSVSYPVSGGVISAPLAGVPLGGAVVNPNLGLVGGPAVGVPFGGPVLGTPVAGFPVGGAVLGAPVVGLPAAGGVFGAPY